MTNIKNLMPKHGETFVLDFTKTAVNQAFTRIRQCRVENEAYFTLLATMALMYGDKLKVPCKACFLETALVYEEAAALLREVAGEKIQVPTGKHDGG